MAGAPSARSAAVAAGGGATAAPATAAAVPRLLPPSRCARAARRARAVVPAAASRREVTLLDYGAGNVRSVRNAIKRLGWTIKDVSCGLVVPFFRKRDWTAR